MSAEERDAPAPVQDAGPISHAVFRVARAHKNLAGQLLREVGLYPGQELLMMRLWDHGPQRQVDLIRALESDAATMTRTIARLERAGFVRRSPHPQDRRSTLVEATPASMPLRVAVEAVWARLEAATVHGLSPEQQRAALEALLALEAGLEASGPREPSLRPA